jgi:hypothetical protein
MLPLPLFSNLIGQDATQGRCSSIWPMFSVVYSNYPSPLKRQVKERIASLSIVGCNITINAADSGCKHYVILGNLSRSKALYIFSVSPPYIYNHLLFMLRARPQLSPLHANPGATPPPSCPSFLVFFCASAQSARSTVFTIMSMFPLTRASLQGTRPYSHVPFPSALF